MKISSFFGTAILALALAFNLQGCREPTPRGEVFAQANIKVDQCVRESHVLTTLVVMRSIHPENDRLVRHVLDVRKKCGVSLAHLGTNESELYELMIQGCEKKLTNAKTSSSKGQEELDSLATHCEDIRNNFEEAKKGYAGR